MSDEGPAIVLSPKGTALLLLYILLFLIVAQIIGLFMQFGLGYKHIYGLVPLFDFNTEQNIPTLFNTLLFILNSICLFLIWRIPGIASRTRWIWLFLSIIFLFLALDEFCELHEKLSAPVHQRFSTTGLLYYAWVIPYGIAALLLIFFFIPVWWRMEKKIRFYFALAALLYLSGSILLEMFGGKEYQQLGDQLDLKCGILATFEESLEMGGLILFVYSLMALLLQKSGRFSLRIQ